MQRRASNFHWCVAPVACRPGKAGIYMRGNVEEDLITRIYEAAVIPDLWPDVLDRLAAISECDGGFLFVASVEQRISYTATQRYEPMMRKYVGDDWMQRCIRAARVLPLNYNGFLTDFDVASPEEIETHPYYTDFLRPNLGGWAAGTAIRMPSGDLAVFNLERAHSRGPVDRLHLPALDRFRPHLARAGLLATRLGIERIKAASAALTAFGLPAAVLNEKGMISDANPLFQSLLDTLVLDRNDRLRLTDQRADRLLASALESISSRENPTAVKSIPVRATDDRLPYILHLLPVEGLAHDVFSPATSLLIVTPVDRAAVPSAEVLQGLFDLTPAESRVAQGIVQAQTIESLAVNYGLSRETIRNQLKAVLAKTGLSRQQELISLLAGKRAPHLLDGY